MFLAMRIVLSSRAMHHTLNLYLTIAFSSEEKHAARIYPFGILTFRCFVTWYKMQVSKHAQVEVTREMVYF